MAIWPLSLPQALNRQGFGHTAPANRVAFQPELGPPMVRRRGSGAPERVTGSIVVDTDDWQVFQEFWHDTLRDGTDTFVWVHPITGQHNTTFLFDGEPQTAPASGTLMRVTMSLLILP